jgi:2-hydroxymuconate-semialdehyde hydrolase
MPENPEIGLTITVDGIATNYHDMGEATEGTTPVLFIHGSGPGVSAWANWRLNMPVLADRGFRCLAPDMMGFGYTDAPEGLNFSLDGWVDHLSGFTTALGLEKFSIVGNSFGGALALAYAIRYPEQIDKIVLMGAVGVEFPITAGLDLVWGYEASLENMRKLLGVFAHDTRFVNDDLAEMRHRATLREGVMEKFSAMFPAPRQESVRMMASSEDAIARIEAPALIVHGREDQVIPVENSRRFFELMPNSELHLFRNCGHWTQIEKTDRFNDLLSVFLR